MVISGYAAHLSYDNLSSNTKNTLFEAQRKGNDQLTKNYLQIIHILIKAKKESHQKYSGMPNFLTRENIQ